MQKHLSKRRLIPVAVALLALVCASGVVYAYWTAGGSGTGTGHTAAGVTNLTVNQTTVLLSMYPGDTAQTISGNFTNTNSGPVWVTSVTASIASVVKGAGAGPGPCDASDFTLANTVATVNAEVPVGSPELTVTWTGPTIKFNDKVGPPAVNQDGCKDATVTLAYVIS